MKLSLSIWSVRTYLDERKGAVSMMIGERIMIISMEEFIELLKYYAYPLHVVLFLPIL